MNLPQCKTCKLYRGDRCSVHPQGVLVDKCDDYRLHYETELPESQLTRLQQYQIFMTHPMFTGLCPQCRYIYEENSDRLSWNCPMCRWEA